MTLHDGKKLVGRFFKKNDPTKEHLDITNFDLEEISEADFIYPDNIESSIIHKDMHSPTELSTTIKSDNLMTDNFANPKLVRPILVPLDFTEEWRKQKQNAYKKSHLHDEEDEFEMEQEYLRRQSLRSEQILSGKSAKKENPLDVGFDENEEKNEDDTISDPKKEDGEIIHTESEEKQAMENIGSKINETSREEKAEESSIEDLSQEARKITNSDENPNDTKFVEMNTELTPDGENPEIPTISEYKEKAELQRELNEEEKKMIEVAKDKGYSEGYSEGFRLGEEKGTLQAKEQAKNIHDELNKVISEFEGMEKNILHNAQENFLVVCQAMMEAILKKEFELNPESLLSVLNTAIEDAVTEDNFKVHLNPETIKSIDEILSDDLRTKIIADDSISAGDFKIDSNMAVVDGNIGTLIEKLIKQNDLELFGEKIG